MSEVLLFAGLVLLSNIVFGAIAAAFLLRFRPRLDVAAWPLALAGFGLGPYLMTVVLYYLLLIVPATPPALMVGLPAVAFGLLAWRSGDGWRAFRELFGRLPRSLRDPSMWPLLLGSALLLLVAILFLANKPLVDHDVLEYGVQGRVFLRDGAIRYTKYRFDTSTGFHYVGLHGFSFPLLFTWEGAWGSFLGMKSDLWVRSITVWYGWLMILFLWWIFRSMGRWMAVAGGLAMTASVGFIFLVTIYHLDSYRIFFFATAMAAFVVLFRGPSLPRVLLFAVLCAAVSFIHSIGAILTVVLWAVLLLLLPIPFAQRMRWAAPAIGVMLALGGAHYVLDILFGTGWILQDIIWF